MKIRCRECGSENLEKEEGVFLVTGNITDLDQEEIWKCKDCGCPNYLIIERHIDGLEGLEENLEKDLEKEEK